MSCSALQDNTRFINRQTSTGKWELNSDIILVYHNVMFMVHLPVAINICLFLFGGCVTVKTEEWDKNSCSFRKYFCNWNFPFERWLFLQWMSKTLRSAVCLHLRQLFFFFFSRMQCFFPRAVKTDFDVQNWWTCDVFLSISIKILRKWCLFLSDSYGRWL